MTIQNRELNNRLSNLERCAELAPTGTYLDVKRAVRAIGGAIEEIRYTLQAAGFQAAGDDRCRNLEVEIYAFLLASNPNYPGFAVGEGFGEHVNGPAGARIIAQAAADRRALLRATEGR